MFLRLTRREPRFWPTLAVACVMASSSYIPQQETIHENGSVSSVCADGLRGAAGAGAAGGGAAASDARSSQPVAVVPIAVGGEKQVFIDNRFIARVPKRRVVHEPAGEAGRGAPARAPLGGQEHRLLRERHRARRRLQALLPCRRPREGRIGVPGDLPRRPALGASPDRPLRVSGATRTTTSSSATRTTAPPTGASARRSCSSIPTAAPSSDSR